MLEDVGDTNGKGEWESGRRKGEIHQGDGAYFVVLMNEATRKLKWQLRNIISSAVKRVSRNCARGSARFIRVQQALPTRFVPHFVSVPTSLAFIPFRKHSKEGLLGGRDFIPRELFRYNNNRGNLSNLGSLGK